MASGPQTYPLPAAFDSPPLVAHNQEVVLPSSSALPPSLRSQGMPRISRSGSMSNQQAPDPFAFGLHDIHSHDDWSEYRSRPTTAISLGPNGDSSPDSYLDDDDCDGPSEYTGFRARVGSMDNAYSRPGTSSRRGTLTSQPSMENFGLLSAGHGNEVPQEYRAEVDRIFFEFLNRTCSNRRSSMRVLWLWGILIFCLFVCVVDATDAKGEPIHQTLMAKKMQRLDESPDFRPFKFRIQAFTNAFLEEVYIFYSCLVYTFF